jgi:hypothetical protein
MLQGSLSKINLVKKKVSKEGSFWLLAIINSTKEQMGQKMENNRQSIHIHSYKKYHGWRTIDRASTFIQETSWIQFRFTNPI